NQNKTINCTMPIAAPLVITAGCPIPGVQGMAYSFPITTTGGTQPLTFTLATGSLAPGLSLNSSTGVISGSPAAGTYSFTVQISDAGPGPMHQTVTYNCGISIAPTLRITTQCPAIPGNAGKQYS